MNILVASNNLFRRELSCFILSEAGYTVHEASDSLSLQHCLHTVRPGLVLLDDSFGHVHGIDAARFIREQDEALPIIALTRNATLMHSVGGPAAQSDRQLAWPYQADDLLTHVHALVQQRGRTVSPAFRGAPAACLA